MAFFKKPKFGGARSERHSDRPSRFADRHDRNDRPRRNEMHDVTCDKCGARTQVPFKPTNGTPVYCNACFGKEDYRPNRAERRSPQQPGDLSQIHMKLDKIMRALKIE